MRYSATLYNVEGLEQDVHEPVIVHEWPTCKVKKNEEWSTQASTSLEQEHKGEW